MSENDELDDAVFAALALGVEPVEPPPGMRERILEAARRQEEKADVVSLPRLQQRRRMPRVPLAAAAAFVAVALGAGLLAGDAIGHRGAQPQVAQVTRFRLSGHGPLAEANATVVDLNSDGVAFVSFSGLPDAPPGKVYELWLITPAGRADPAGVFVPDSNGAKVVVVSHALTGYQLMAVTIEAGPAGVSAPTQQPQIYGTVT